MKSEYKTLLVLFTLALLTRVPFVFVSPLKIWDETVYANLGSDLSENPFNYSFAKKWTDWVPGDWPKAGFRPPLLPYTLSILYFLNLDFFVEFLMPIIGALSVIFVFIIAKKMFNEKIALYSSLFLTFLPLHVIYSGKILTGVFSTFFIILSVLCFWLGFEKKKNKYKLVFGVFLGLSVLARYTVLWIIPVFPLYLIIKNKNLLFLKDRFAWLAIGLFFLVLSPWFVYGNVEYGNPLGQFFHALRAASYWGGSQPWYFFFQHSLQMFSVVSIIFLMSLFFIVSNKKIRRNSAVLFLLLWFFIFFVSASLMSHKEDRFLLQLTPPLVILSAVFLDNTKYKKHIITLVVLLLIFQVCVHFIYLLKISYTQTNLCFLKATKFLESTPNDSVIITDEFPVIYYYIKRETHFYPNPFNLLNLRDLIDNYYNGRPTYILFTEYDMPLENPDNIAKKEVLDSNFNVIFRCPDGGLSSLVYEYK